MFTVPSSSTSIFTPVCSMMPLDHLAAGSDQLADLVGGNFSRVDARSVLRELARAACRDRRVHLVENLQAGLLACSSASRMIAV